jgi:hypothetical protein
LPLFAWPTGNQKKLHFSEIYVKKFQFLINKKASFSRKPLEKVSFFPKTHIKKFQNCHFLLGRPAGNQNCPFILSLLSSAPTNQSIKLIKKKGGNGNGKGEAPRARASQRKGRSAGRQW